MLIPSALNLKENYNRVQFLGERGSAVEWDGPASMVKPTLSVKDKVHAFREKAEKAKLKAAATSESVAKKIFEDAAQEWQDLADKLERTGRPY